jgi:hypothetical protein
VELSSGRFPYDMITAKVAVSFQCSKMTTPGMMISSIRLDLFRVIHSFFSAPSSGREAALFKSYITKWKKTAVEMPRGSCAFP